MQEESNTIEPEALTFASPETSSPFNAEEPEYEAEEAEEEEIVTDRDSFTPATSTVKRGRVVFESAYSFIDNDGVPETHSFPESVIRFGTTDNLELRIGWNYEIGGSGNPVSGNASGHREPDAALEEESTLLYGAKYFLTRQCGWTPESSWLVHGFTPTGGESNDSRLATTHVFGWRLPNKSFIDFGNRFGTSSHEGDDFNVWSPSTVIKIPVGSRWKAHAEYFGIFSDGREEETVQHFFSPGAHFLATPDFEIGLRVGWGLNEQTPPFFSNFGIGWQY
jgi:hypothetical protein